MQFLLMHEIRSLTWILSVYQIIYSTIICIIWSWVICSIWLNIHVFDYPWISIWIHVLLVWVRMTLFRFFYFGSDFGSNFLKRIPIRVQISECPALTKYIVGNMRGFLYRFFFFVSAFLGLARLCGGFDQLFHEATWQSFFISLVIF